MPPEITLDTIMQDIQELTTTVKEHGDNLASLDINQLAETFQTQVDDLKALNDAALPDRRGEFVNQEQLDAGVVAAKSLDPNNKYRSMAVEIAGNGKFMWGGVELTKSDLWLTYKLQADAHRIKKINNMADIKTDGPSEDLTKAIAAMAGVEYASQADALEKLMDPSVSGAGAELTFTSMTSSLWEDFFTASRIASDMNIVPMPTDPFEIPLGLGSPTWRKGEAGQPTDTQDPLTQKVTLTSTEQIVDLSWTYDLDEQAVISMVPTLRRLLSRTGAEQMDYFALNADGVQAATGNINLDDDTPPDDASYLTNGQDGVRKLWIVDNSNQGLNVAGALDDVDMGNMLAKLGKYYMDYQNVRIAPSIRTYFSMLGLDNVATVDKYGPGATILSGELGRYRGVPILPSDSQPDTEADGKVSKTAANNIKGQISTYHRDMWVTGYPRQLLIEMVKDIRSRKLIMVASFKIAIAGHGTRSTAQHTAGAYNITLP